MKRILFFIMLLICSTSAFAYKPYLHQQFADKAIQQSTNFKYAVNNLWGPEFSEDSFSYWFNPKPDVHLESLEPLIRKQGNYVEMIKFGALWEDDEKPANQLGLRPFNHFFDPQHNRGLQADIPVWSMGLLWGYGIVPAGADYFILPGPVYGNPSPDWILEDKHDAYTSLSIMTYEEQKFSYKDALGYMYDGFTLSTSEERLQSIADMYQSLGHVLHHIGDMGQPQHTRNDSHCDACPVNDISGYEVLTGGEDNVKKMLNEAPGLFDRTQYSLEPVMFNSPRDYWVNSQGSGMAEFTSENFVTTETNYRIVKEGTPIKGLDNGTINIIPGLYFTKPSTEDLIVTTEIVGEAIKGSIFGNLVPDAALDAKMGFLGRNIYDPYTEKYSLHKRMASFSVFAHDLQKNFPLLNPGGARFLTVNQINHEDRLSILFPRIVAFSSGLLDFFSKVEIRLIPVDGGDQFEIQNLTRNETEISGKFEIYDENSAGVRTLRESRNLTLAYGETALVTVPGLSSSTKALILVFKGQVGDDVNTRLYAVGGRHIQYNYENQYCTGNKVISGEDDFIGTYDMGHQAGLMTLDYDAHGSKDRFAVYYNGQYVASTGSKITGKGKLQFNYDPAISTKVRIHVDAKDEYSAWNFTLQCAVEGEDPEDPDECAWKSTYEDNSVIISSEDMEPLPVISLQGNEEVGTEIVQSMEEAIEYVNANRSLDYQMYTNYSEAGAGCEAERNSKSSSYWNMVCLQITTGNYRGYRLWYQILGNIDGGNRSPSATLHLVPNVVFSGGTYDGQGAASADCKTYVQLYISQGISNLKGDCDNPIRDDDGRWYVRNYYVSLEGESYCEHRYYWGERLCPQ